MPTRQSSVATVRRSLGERIAWYALTGMPILVPLAIFPPMSTSTNPYGGSAYTAPKLLGLGVLVAVALVGWAVAAARREIELRDLPTKWWLLGFLGLALVSTVTALNPTTAVFGHSANLVGLVTFLVCASVFFLATQLVSSVGRAETITRTTAIGGALVAIIGLTQVYWFDPLQMALADEWMYERAVSTIGNPDFTGTYLVLPLVLSAALGLADRDPRRKAGWWAAAALIGSALFLTLTRGAWVGAVVGLGVLAIAAERSSVRLPKVALGAAAVGAVLVAAALLKVSPGLIRRYNELSAGWATFTSGRTYLWREALSMIARHPLFGVGPDSYRLGWFPVRSLASVVSGAGSVTNDAHDIVLTLAATLGVPAMLAAVGLFAATMASGLKSSFVHDAQPERLMLSGWWAALLATGVALLFSVNTIVIMLAVSLGLAMVIAPRVHPVAAGAASRSTFALLAVVIAVPAVAIPALSFASDYTIAVGATSSPSLPLISKAVAQAPWNFSARNLEAYYASARAVAALQAQNSQADTFFAEADQKTRDLIAFNPYEYDSYFTRARLLTDAGQILGVSTLEEAVAVTDAGLRVQPNSVRMLRQKALALFALGRYEEAVQILEPKWDVVRTYAPAGAVYAQTLAAAGRSEDAMTTIEDLQRRFPEDPDVAAASAALSQTPQPTP